MSSPAELLGSCLDPGRFGLEFIRNVKDAEDGDGLTSRPSAPTEEDADYGRLGRSLGSGDGSDRNLYGWKISDVLPVLPELPPHVESEGSRSTSRPFSTS